MYILYGIICFREIRVEHEFHLHNDRNEWKSDAAPRAISAASNVDPQNENKRKKDDFLCVCVLNLRICLDTIVTVSPGFNTTSESGQ